MTELPRRSGVGFFPEPVVIRSGPTPGQQYDPLAQRPNDWLINPARRGADGLARAPIFLPSKSNYDDLGRSMEDGVEVELDDGKAVRREVDNGDSVAAWYTELSRPGSGASTPGAGPSRPPRIIPTEPIDLTGDDDEDEDEDDSSDLKPTPDARPEQAAERPLQPVRVHRNEWYIRRALLRQAQLSDAPPRPPAPHRPSSIGALVNVDTTRPPRVQPAHYVLGPENRGYMMLKDRLGWEGGGLGRPVGWTAPDAAVSRDEDSQPQAGPSRLAEKLEAEIEAAEIVKAEYGVVDLTIDSDEEEGSGGSEDEEEEDLPRPSGPGRTAPIATALKLDRLGIGHTRHTRRGNLEAAKKVTHTAKEIEKARQRAKYAGKPMTRLELGKKGKIKWAEKDKREREHRQRLAAAINA